MIPALIALAVIFVAGAFALIVRQRANWRRSEGLDHD